MKSTSVLVDQKQVNAPHKENIRGVDVSVMASPFDIPRVASCNIHQHGTAKDLKIQFSYLSQPEKVQKIRSNSDGGITMVLDKNTGRLQELVFDAVDFLEDNIIDTEERTSILERLVLAIGDYLGAHESGNEANFHVIQDVLKSYGEILIPDPNSDAHLPK